MTYCILLVKDQNSFDEISGLAICVNIEVFNRVNIKQLKTLKRFLEYLEFFIVAY